MLMVSKIFSSPKKTLLNSFLICFFTIVFIKLLEACSILIFIKSIEISRAIYFLLIVCASISFCILMILELDTYYFGTILIILEILFLIVCGSIYNDKPDYYYFNSPNNKSVIIVETYFDFLDYRVNFYAKRKSSIICRHLKEKLVSMPSYNIKWKDNNTFQIDGSDYNMDH